jgi:peptide/nickel transport system substrate-binding protein
MYWMKMIPPKYAKDPNFASHPIGTGPYVFDSWSRGENIILKANPKYWGGAPSIGQVTYRFIGKVEDRLSGLKAGKLDLITNLPAKFVKTVPKSAVVQGLETSVIVLSTENQATKDLRVRKALNLAIDRQALATNLFGGYAKVAQGQLVNPKAHGFDAALKPYPYDPDQAKALIKEAGAEGKTVTLQGEVGRWLEDRETIEAVAADWTAIGLKVDVQISKFGEYLNRLFDEKHRPDAIFVSNSDELLDADRAISSAYEAGRGYASNNDQAMAAEAKAARAETDPVKRATMDADIIKKAYDGYYLAPLLNIDDVYGLSRRLVWKPRVDAKLLVKEMTTSGALGQR